MEHKETLMHHHIKNKCLTHTWCRNTLSNDSSWRFHSCITPSSGIYASFFLHVYHFPILKCALYIYMYACILNNEHLWHNISFKMNTFLHDLLYLWKHKPERADLHMVNKTQTCTQRGACMQWHVWEFVHVWTEDHRTHALMCIDAYHGCTHASAVLHSIK